MSKLLVFAVISITLALVFYSIGVWGERRAGVIKGKHVAFFGLGFLCDTTGTSLMKIIVTDHLRQISSTKAILHEITGELALTLMLVHFIWALWVWMKGSEKAKENFHKFSIVVWSFWLIPYFLGMIIGMTS